MATQCHARTLPEVVPLSLATRICHGDFLFAVFIPHCGVMQIRVGGLVVATAAIMAACSGGGDGDEGEGGGAASSAPTVAAVTTTAAPEPTVAPTTSPPPTTVVPATSEAPTTTIDPALTLAQEVEADYRRAEALRIEALMHPNSARAEKAATAVRLGSNRRLLRETLLTFRDNGWAARANPQVEAVQILESGPILRDDGTVELVRCQIDSWILVEAGGAPDGSDAIVNDDVYAYRNRIVLKNSGGTWKILDGVQLGEWVGVGECPAF